MFSYPVTLDLCYNCKVDYPLSKKIGHVKLMAQATTERLRKRHLKSDFALRQICSRLFHLVQYVKFWQIFLALNSKRLYVSKFRKVKESCCLVLTSSKKHEIRHFQVVVVQRMYKKVWCTCKVVVLPLPFCRCLFSTSLTLFKFLII